MKEIIRMKRIISVEPLPDYRLRLKFEDGVTGEVDLSGEMGKGVFAAWNNPNVFGAVKIGRNGRALVWTDELDLCADALYLEITGKQPEDLFPALKHETTHA